MKITPSLAVCLVIRNEESVLERCLQSVPPWVKERIVVHDGLCSDKSLSICRKYGFTIFERPFIGIAEPHRAWIYQKVKSDWILQLDADEFLSSELQSSLSYLIEDLETTIYSFYWPYWNGQQYLTETWPRKKALFQRRKITFLGFPQEEVRPSSGKITASSLRLEHQPMYNNFTWNRYQTKGIQWIKLHAQYYLMDPQNIVRFPKDTLELSPHYQIINRYPLLALFFVPFYHILGILLSGAIDNGMIGIKIALFSGLYYAHIITLVGLTKLGFPVGLENHPGDPSSSI